MAHVGVCYRDLLSSCTVGVGSDHRIGSGDSSGCPMAQIPEA